MSPDTGNLDPFPGASACKGTTNLPVRGGPITRNAEVRPVQQYRRPGGRPLWVEVQTKVRGAFICLALQPPRGEHLRPVGEDHDVFRVLADHTIIVPGVSQ